MNLFTRRTIKADREEIRQIKNWLYEMSIDKEVHISLSQLSCTEPDCPPIETVITVMSNPAQQYKIYKPIAEIEYTDIYNLTQL
jgi:hypothetical protein